MKHIGAYIGALAGLAMPAVLFAQMSGTSGGAIQALIGIEDQSRIFELISLLSVLIVSLATCVMVWIGGRKMHGGVFGKVLNLFSVGMTLVFLSAIAQIPSVQSANTLYANTAHDLLFIAGFIVMGFAANKLLQVIKGE